METVYYDPAHPERGVSYLPQGNFLVPINYDEWKAQVQQLNTNLELSNPNPDKLWSLFLDPEFGLPIYQVLIQNNESTLLSVLVGTFTGTVKNPEISEEGKLAAVVSALQMLVSVLHNHGALNDYKDIMTSMLIQSGYSSIIQQVGLSN